MTVLQWWRIANPEDEHWKQRIRRGTVVSGNVIDTITDMGIYVDGVRTSVNNNTLRAVSGTNGIRSIAGATTIQGNRLDGVGGIRAEAAGAIILGNHFAVSGTGIALISTASRCCAAFNHLFGTTGTKVSDAGVSNVTTPNITA